MLNNLSKIAQNWTTVFSHNFQLLKYSKNIKMYLLHSKKIMCSFMFVKKSIKTATALKICIQSYLVINKFKSRYL